ncbi:MAG TPA: hypothetical protein VK615_09340, partial [Candidatus Binatia bacterium]|nr:hypothetical protein [Candidatus Binatia bacterium]
MRRFDVSIERRFLVPLLWLLSALAAIASTPSSWTGASVPATAWLRTVEYGDGKFVALGDDGTRLVSTNGT